MKSREIGSALDNKTSVLTVLVENAFIVRGFSALLIRLHRIRLADDRSSRANAKSIQEKRER